jgi:ribonuclease HII
MKKYIIGIDEVGRGALAGPVVVAAALVRKGVIPARAGIQVRGLGTLRDSKKLSPKKRRAWFAYFKDHPAIGYAVARAYPRRIERMNISRAANLAALRACKKLMAEHGSRAACAKIFLDGGLFLGNGGKNPSTGSTMLTTGRYARGGRMIVKTIIRGDEKIPAVAVASIIAKVTRDRFMVRLAKKYPAYGFDAHKGYGTKVHYKALKKHGPSDMHRMTFL